MKLPFAIEHRYSPEIWGFSWAGEWSVWKRYKTEEDRDKALKCLQRKAIRGLEFRVGETGHASTAGASVLSQQG